MFTKIDTLPPLRPIRLVNAASVSRIAIQPFGFVSKNFVSNRLTLVYDNSLRYLSMLSA